MNTLHTPQRDPLNNDFYLINNKFGWVNYTNQMYHDDHRKSIPKFAMLHCEQVELPQIESGRYYVLEFEGDEGRDTILRQVCYQDGVYLLLCHKPETDDDNLNFDAEQMQVFTRIFNVVTVQTNQ